MATVRLTTDGFSRLVDTISRRANLLGTGNVRAIMNAQAPGLLQAFKMNISKMTPGPVQDLTEKYKKQKQRLWGHVYPILDASGDMIRSMRITVLPPSGGGWVFRLLFEGTDHAGVSNATKADAHINGRGRNPVRDFTGIPTAWRQGVINAVRAAFRAGG